MNLEKELEKIYQEEKWEMHSYTCPFPEGCNCGVSNHNDGIVRTINKVKNLFKK